MLISYDFEVYFEDWLCVLKPYGKSPTVIWNNSDELKRYMDTNSIHVFIGFNTKHYDQYVMKAVCSGWSNREIKDLNDFIIAGGNGWEYPKKLYYRFNNADIRDDMQIGFSLKSLEGHMGMNIQETEVDFNLERKLTPEEMELVEQYCIHDVEAVEKLVELRKAYLDNKIFLGKLKGIPEAVALSMTNAKLTAAYLDAEPVQTDDERNYQYPGNLLREYIPQDVFQYFDRMHDTSLSDEEVFGEKFETAIGETPVTLGFGGIHAAIPNYSYEEQDGWIIRNFDVSSYYPHLIIIMGYVSRAMANPDDYTVMLDTRMNAKKSGNTILANALKLVCNTTYGAMGNKYNALYDPLMMRSVCISGQLFLLELAWHLYKDVPSVSIIQLNTDGIMVKYLDKYDSQVQDVLKEWQTRTGFELEEDRIQKIVQKDVNNYVMRFEDGHIKKKGGYVVRGASDAGAFKINNTATIMAEAIVERLLNNKLIDNTINECDDITKFQFIAKGGSTYAGVFHEVDGQRIPVQNCNRVYATADPKYGTLYKFKKGGNPEKIANLPEHCIIDNDNHLTIEDIDKQFYIRMATKQMEEFYHNRRTTVATKATTAPEKITSLNLYQKLNKARLMFQAERIEKSGKNLQLTYKYFELDDIVPAITRIFNELGIISIVKYTPETATMQIINTDAIEQCIEFTAPMVELPTNKAVTAIQALGAVETYQRRYLYLTALDICEPDAVEVMPAAPAEKAEAPKVETKDEKPGTISLAADGEASAQQVAQIKKLCTALIKLNPERKDFVATLQVNTNNFTGMTKKTAEDAIKALAAEIKEAKDGKN